MQEFVKNKLREIRFQATRESKDIVDQVNEFLDEVVSKTLPKLPDGVPPSLLKTDVSVTNAGTIRLCLRTAASAACQFPAEAQSTAHKHKVLDSSIDRCGAGKIWLRDAEKRRFIGIAKGQKNVIVEIESREFPWFCGGASAPEALESATGPVGTYLVSVSRDATGNRIDWKFLAWK